VVVRQLSREEKSQEHLPAYKSFAGLYWKEKAEKKKAPGITKRKKRKSKISHGKLRGIVC